jgi:hypothetical protein
MAFQSVRVSQHYNLHSIKLVAREIERVTVSSLLGTGNWERNPCDSKDNDKDKDYLSCSSSFFSKKVNLTT